MYICHLLSYILCPDIGCQPVAAVRADGEDGLSEGAAGPVLSAVQEVQRPNLPACRSICPGAIHV